MTENSLLIETSDSDSSTVQIDLPKILGNIWKVALKVGTGSYADAAAELPEIALSASIGA